MFWKYFVCSSLFAVVICDTVIYNFEEEPFYELPCLSFGGICVKSGDCPEGKLATVKGLCPVQQKSGVECCHSVPTSETRCRRHGGECMSSKCPDKLIFKGATDCKDNEKCCVLVN